MSVDRSDIDKGLELLKEIGWDDGAAKLKETDEQFWEMTVGHLFGNIWTRPGLSPRDREMITLAVLIALDRERGLRPHLTNAHKLGISDDEMRELIFQVMHYAGWSVGAHAISTFKQVKDERDGTG